VQVLVLGLLLVSAGIGHASTVKECNTEIHVPDRPAVFIGFQVYADENKRLSAHIVETASSGIKNFNENTVAYGGFPIHKWLNAYDKADDLNISERYFR